MKKAVNAQTAKNEIALRLMQEQKVKISCDVCMQLTKGEPKQGAHTRT